MQFGEYDFRTFTFGIGKHASRADGMCVMEAVAYVAGESHSDHPQCACPVLSAFLRRWNDGISDDARRRELLSPFVFRLPGTRGGREIERRRAWMCADWAVRESAPLFMDLTESLRCHAAALRALPEIVDQSTYSAALPAIIAAKKAADAAADAYAYAAAAADADAYAYAYAAADLAAAADAYAYACAYADACDADADADADAAAAADADADAAAAAVACAAAYADADARERLKGAARECHESAARLMDRMIALTEIMEGAEPRELAVLEST